MLVLLCVFLEREPGSCPKAVVLFLDWSSLVFPPSSFHHQQLSGPVPRNSGNVMVAEWGPFPKNKKWGTQKGSCAQDPHRAVPGFRCKFCTLPSALLWPVAIIFLPCSAMLQSASLPDGSFHTGAQVFMFGVQFVPLPPKGCLLITWLWRPRTCNHRCQGSITIKESSCQRPP